MRSMIGLVTIALMASFVSAPASAHHRRHHRRHAARAPYAAVAPSAARVCVPLCTEDVTACDPIEYKLADGRCTNPLMMNF